MQSCFELRVSRARPCYAFRMLISSESIISVETAEIEEIMSWPQVRGKWRPEEHFVVQDAASFTAAVFQIKC